jgi:hypothetical protein
MQNARQKGHHALIPLKRSSLRLSRALAIMAAVPWRGIDLGRARKRVESPSRPL